MAKPEWGVKRICLNCGARFYDMNSSPIVCPNCGTTFDVEVATRARKARPGRAVPIEDDEPKKVVKKAVVADDVDEADDHEGGEDTPDAEVEDDAEEADDAEVVAETDEEEEEDAPIEDVEELDDGDDISDVIEGGNDEDEETR